MPIYSILFPCEIIGCSYITSFPENYQSWKGWFLHCCLYRGTVVALQEAILRHDGSIPGPFPLICSSQRILNSCSALIKYRRVQTSLHRIIICSERRLPECSIYHLCLSAPHPSVPHTTDSKTVHSSASPKIQEQVAGPCRNIGT